MTKTVDFDSFFSSAKMLTETLRDVNKSMPGVMNTSQRNVDMSLTSKLSDDTESTELSSQQFETAFTALTDNFNALNKFVEDKVFGDLLDGVKFLTESGATTDIFDTKIDPNILLTGTSPATNITNIANNFQQLAQPAIGEVTSGVSSKSFMVSEISSSHKSQIEAMTGNSSIDTGFNSVGIVHATPNGVASFLSSFSNMNNNAVKDVINNLVNAQLQLPAMKSYLVINTNLSSNVLTSLTKELLNINSLFANFVPTIVDNTFIDLLLNQSQTKNEYQDIFEDVGVTDTPTQHSILKLIYDGKSQEAYENLRAIVDPSVTDTSIETTINKLENIFR
jgi:hypothetical protein